MDTDTSNSEMEQIKSEISAGIQLLCNFDGDSLKCEMQALKKTLTENPAACSLLLEEDIGLAVAALRRMVGIAVSEANAPKSKSSKSKSKKLTPEELKAQLDAIGDDEL